MGTWIKGIPPKMMHDTAGVYQGKWMSEMDHGWIRKEDKRAVNRGYHVTQEEIRELHAYYAERK